METAWAASPSRSSSSMAARQVIDGSRHAPSRVFSRPSPAALLAYPADERPSPVEATPCRKASPQRRRSFVSPGGLENRARRIRDAAGSQDAGGARAARIRFLPAVEIPQLDGTKRGPLGGTRSSRPVPACRPSRSGRSPRAACKSNYPQSEIPASFLPYVGRRFANHHPRARKMCGPRNRVPRWRGAIARW